VRDVRPGGRPTASTSDAYDLTLLLLKGAWQTGAMFCFGMGHEEKLWPLLVALLCRPPEPVLAVPDGPVAAGVSAVSALTSGVSAGGKTLVAETLVAGRGYAMKVMMPILSR